MAAPSPRTVVYAHPAWYAAHGYIVAVQDVRGCGTSGGEFRLFEHEAEDGADAVAWAAALPGSSGDVGMYGFAYQGNTQLLALSAGAPALKALCPAMVAWDMHADWAYEGGAFRLADNLAWGIQMAAEAARRRQDFIAHQALYAASRNLPLDEELPTHPRVLRGYARYSHYDDWLGNPLPGGLLGQHFAARTAGGQAGGRADAVRRRLVRPDADRHAQRFP